MLDFIKDIFAAFRQNSLERMKSPFLGAFVFSWLGFNWQLLAILFISKKDVEERIVYINQHFGIESLLIGPLFTTTLICILLPQATKYIIKFQSKPISAATVTTMTEKIALAEKQLEIADIESKKRLSDKREERNIEEDIYSTKSQNIALTEAVKDRDNSLKEMSNSLQEVMVEVKTATANMVMLSDQNEKLQKIIKEKDTELRQSIEQKIKLELDTKSLSNDLKHNKLLLTSLQNQYPDIFKQIATRTVSLDEMNLNRKSHHVS